MAGPTGPHSLTDLRRVGLGPVKPERPNGLLEGEPGSDDTTTARDHDTRPTLTPISSPAPVTVSGLVPPPWATSSTPPAGVHVDGKTGSSDSTSSEVLESNHVNDPKTVGLAPDTKGNVLLTPEVNSQGVRIFGEVLNASFYNALIKSGVQNPAGMETITRDQFINGVDVSKLPKFYGQDVEKIWQGLPKDASGNVSRTDFIIGLTAKQPGLLPDAKIELQRSVGETGTVTVTPPRVAPAAPGGL